MTVGKFKASPEIVASDLGDGAALFDIRSGIYYDLNQSGSILWTLLSEPRSILDLATELSSRCDVDLDTSIADTRALVEDLLSHKLVTIDSIP